MKKIFLLLCFFPFFLSNSYSQGEEKPLFAHNTFEGTRVVVGHSVEMLRKGDLDFLISHKFGRLNSGAYEFFGLDQAIIRLGFDYAPLDWLNIGIGRSSQDKILDGFAKVRLLRQQTGKKNIPVTITGLSAMTYSLLKELPNKPLVWSNRINYTNQIMIARQFSERFSLQLTPSVTHFNLVETRDLKNDVISIGIAGKYQVTKSIAFKAEYFYNLPDQLESTKTNSLALGFDFDTGSHVFQLHLSNSGGLVEPAFIGDTNGDWLDGDIHLGFTISRVFRLKGRRY